MKSLLEALQLTLEHKLEEKKKHVGSKIAGGVNLGEEIERAASEISHIIKAHNKR